MPKHNRKMSFLSKLFLFRKVENPMKKKIAKLCKRPAKECPDNIIFVGTEQLFSLSSYLGFDFQFDIVIRKLNVKLRMSGRCVLGSEGP